MAAPIEAKVTAASVAAFLSSEALGELAVLIGAPVAAWAVQLVTGAVTGLVTLAAGWLAKHTPRGAETLHPYPHAYLKPALSINVAQAAEIVDRWRAAQSARQPTVQGGLVSPPFIDPNPTGPQPPEFDG